MVFSFSYKFMGLIHAWTLLTECTVLEMDMELDSVGLLSKEVNRGFFVSIQSIIFAGQSYLSLDLSRVFFLFIQI
jgi:hypothetical protein